MKTWYVRTSFPLTPEVRMLPPFIIEQIRRREEQQREQRPVLELPLDEGRPLPLDGPSVSPSPEAEQKPERGVIVVDL